MRLGACRSFIAGLVPALVVAGSASAQEAKAQEPRVAGQQQEPELWLLKSVIDRAVERVRPSVVMVETFGGTRKVVSGQRPRPQVPQPDEEPQPKPAPMPDQKGPPKDKDEQDPDKPEKPGKDGEKDGDKKDDKKPLPPIRMPGFIQAQGPSTGLIIGSDGWILTSRIALSWGPSTVIVTLDDGRKFTAKIMGHDETRGLAMLKVDAKDLPLPELAPEGKVEVGQWAFAIARTFSSGKQPTVHAGMISAVGRISGRAVQCDTYTSPANYGGPLIDLEGRVLGLVTPLSPQGDMAGVDWYDSGIGFAATLTDIADKIDGMKQGAIYKKGMLGVLMDQAFLGPGGKVNSTMKKSAANHADLRKGDTIVAIDGVLARHSMHLQDLVGRHVAHDWVTIKVRKKDGAEVEVLVQLDEG